MEVQLVILVLELFILHGSAGLTLNSPVISPSVPQTVEPLSPSTSLSPPKVPPPDKSVPVPLMPLTPPVVAPIDNSPPLTPTVQKPLPLTPPPVSHERTSDAHSPITMPQIQVPIASPSKMVPVIPLPERSSTPGVAPIISDHMSPISVPPPNTSRKDNGVPIVSPPYKSADAPKTSEVLVPSVPPSSLMIPPVNTPVLVPPSSPSPPVASPTVKSAPIVSTPYKSADAPKSSKVLVPSVPPSPLMIPPINTSVLVPPSSIDPPVASPTIKPAPLVSTPYKSADAPKSSEVLVPSVPPSPLIIPPINTSVLVPPSSIDPPVVSPTIKPAPFVSTPYKSAYAPTTSEVLRPLMISPIDTSVLVPSTSINPPVISPTIKPAPRIKTPELVPPTPQTISPEKALGVGHLIPVSHPQVPIAPPPRKLPERPLPVHPPALGVTPTVSDHVPPTSVPPARISKKEHGIPVAAPPPKETPNSWSPPPVQEHAVSPASTPPPTTSMKDHGLPFAAPPPETSHYLSPMNQPPIKEHEVSPISNPPPSTSKKEYGIPIASPPKKTFHQISPKSHSTTKGHAMSPKSVPPPIIGKKEYTTPVAAPPKQTHDKLSPMSHPPQKGPTNPGAPRPPRLPKKHRFTPLAPSYPPTVPPKKSRPRHHSPPTSFPGFISPTQPPLPAADARESPAPSPSTIISSSQTKKHVPRPPMISPLASPPRKQKMPLPPPVRALPPPPPNKDCASLTCSEPTTNSPPGAPCACVIPIKVELRLGVALYTFFPLVSELAVEIASGVFMKQSQVRIMGANAATQQLEKTDVLIDLVPLGDKFDNTTALLTFQRFWQKQIVIQSNFFGDYQVLYVTYPGLPPSPPFADSSITIIDGVPYIDPGNNARTMHPLGVDVPQGKKRGLAGSIIAIIVLSSFAVLVLCIGAAWLLAVKCRNHTQVIAKTPRTSVPSLAKQSAGGARSTLFGSGISSASLSFGSSITAYAGTAKTFSAHEIERATDNYSESRILGEGGFGVVYKGILDDGKEVAVKVLKRDDQQGGREFLAEVEMLSRLHHRNLVKLIGICIEDHSHSLVYELIPNGSVESHLHGVHKETAPLDWASRMKIALGSARGLAYLHEDSSPHVIHRDFKSSNILLEDDFTPKVSDFGLARSALEEGSNHISTRVMGTFGYVAPEYAMTGHLLVKSDVYSYGVVLLELLTGRKPVDMSQPEGQENLVAWARPLLTSREGLEIIIDPALGSSYTFDNVAKVAAIASMCVQPEVTHRPFMGEVVQALKLVCEETTEVEGSESSIVDIDTNKASGSGRLLGSECGHYSDYDSSPENDGGLSASDMFSSTSRFGRHQQMSGSFRRHSSSGPLRPGRTRQFWKRVKGVSRGSVSEHGFAYRLWGES